MIGSSEAVPASLFPLPDASRAALRGERLRLLDLPLPEVVPRSLVTNRIVILLALSSAPFSTAPAGGAAAAPEAALLPRRGLAPGGDAPKLKRLAKLDLAEADVALAAEGGLAAALLAALALSEAEELDKEGGMLA
eukprot:288093_1